jgi:anti-anti-sigma regulatory factor
VRLEVELREGGELHLCLRDWGRWRQPSPDEAPPSTRGLAIVRGMVDRLHIETGEEGTLVTVHHRLSRPAQMLTGTDTDTDRLPQGGVDRPFSLRREARGRLGVFGPVDAEHVHDLRDALREASPTDRVVLDLQGVTLLPSVAVQTLYAARREASDRGGQLVLFAPPGSTAQHVLELVQLPYTLRDPDDSPAEGVRRPRA